MEEEDRGKKGLFGELNDLMTVAEFHKKINAVTSNYVRIDLLEGLQKLDF